MAEKEIDECLVLRAELNQLNVKAEEIRDVLESMYADTWFAKNELKLQDSIEEEILEMKNMLKQLDKLIKLKEEQLEEYC